MLRSFVSGKLHGIKITECKLRYNGSCEVDPALLDAAGINYFEQVHILNMTNGSRIITYVFPGGRPGSFTLNGGAARHGAEGDECIIVAYRQEEKFSGAKCVIIDPQANTVQQILNYPAGRSPAQDVGGKAQDPARYDIAPPPTVWGSP